MVMTKIATNWEQGKLLAEILPIESADMRYDYINATHIDGTPKVGFNKYPLNSIPAWSLSALLELLPPKLVNDATEYTLEIYKNPDKSYEVGYFYKVWAFIASNNEDLVDACVEMIIKLKEEDLL